MHIVVEFRDAAFTQFASRMEKLGSGQGLGIMAQALNEGGHAMRAQTVAAETAQTGLEGGTIDRAQREIFASSGSLAYTIWSEGGNVRLKYFGAKEGGGGVTAHPWNRSTFYGGHFITSGRPGNRRVVLGGHVYHNIQGGKWGGKIAQSRSGLFIPTEMTKGQTASAFEAGSAGVLSNIVITRLGSLLP